jgi:hypothetical protein
LRFYPISSLGKAGALCAGLCLTVASAVAQEVPSLDLLLRGEGAPGAALGPTGRHLFTHRLECAPGLPGRFGYGLFPVPLADPVLLFVGEGDSEIEFESVERVWYPSHTMVRWRGAGLELVERKYITWDDTAAVDFELRDIVGEGIRELRLELRGSSTPRLERARSKFTPVDLTFLGEDHLSREGAASLAPGRLEHDGVVFHLLGAAGSGPAPGVVAPEDGTPVPIPLPDVEPAIAQLHLLFAGNGANPPPIEVRLSDGSRAVLVAPADGGDVQVVGGTVWRRVLVPGSSARVWHVSYDPPPGRFARELLLRGGFAEAPYLLAATVERPPRTGRLPVLLGELRRPSATAHLCLAGTEFALHRTVRGERRLQRWVSLPSGETLSFRAVLSSGSGVLPALAGAIDATRDERFFESHLVRYHRWFEEEVPRFFCSDPGLEYAFGYSAFLLRSHLLVLDERHYSLPIFHEGGSGSGPPLLRLSSLPAILAEARWLSDLRHAQGQVRAFVIRQREDGTLPRSLPLAAKWGNEHRLPAAIIDVFAVHGSELFLRENLPLLQSSAESRIERGLDPGVGGFLTHQAAAELPALARGRRALREEEEAVALDQRFRDLRDRGYTLPPVETEEDTATVTSRISAQVEKLCSGNEELSIDTPRSGCLDLLIRYVGGLRPRDDGRIELRPRYPDLAHFSFEGLRYRDRVIDIFWDRPGGARAFESIPEGYSVLIDGVVCFHGLALTDVVLD